MTPKEAAALLAAAAIAASIFVAAKEDPPPQDVKPLATEIAKGTIPSTTVYKVSRSDGGMVYASKYSKPDAGAVVIYLDESPCAWRPIKGADCVRFDGGDPGDENTMQAGEWFGAGCIRKACVIFAGESEGTDVKSEGK